MFSLINKVALVTGGSRGLGLAMSKALGLAGATIVITARKIDELRDAQSTLESLGIHAVALCNDLADRSSIPALVDEVLDRVGPIDILVNNAGATWGAPAEEYSQAAWDKVINVNINGTWALTQEVARRCMIPRQQGSIITIASAAGVFGNAPGQMQTVAYNTSKAGQINMTRSLAGEWGKYGIRVNSLLPGWFPTRMTHGTLEFQDEASNSLPMGRFGTDEDLAGPIVFLASEAARYVTGHALAVDGGMLAVK